MGARKRSCLAFVCVLVGCATTEIPQRQRVLFDACYAESALECPAGNATCQRRRLDEFQSVEGNGRRLRWLHARGCRNETIGLPAETPRPSEAPAPTSFAVRNAGIGLAIGGYALSLIGGSVMLANGGGVSGVLMMLPLFGPPLSPAFCGGGQCGLPIVFGPAATAAQLAGAGMMAGGWNGFLSRPAD